MSRVTTKPRNAPWWPDMFVHADTEIRDSEHIGCGSPVRHQHLRSVPPVVTDESAVATAEAAAFVEYCPACDVRVEARKTSYKTVTT